MSGQGIQILLDTGVWLDFFISGRAGSATAIRLVRDAVGRGVRLLYPARAVCDLFYEIRRDAANWVRSSASEVSRDDLRACQDYAWACLEDLREMADAVAVDDSDIWVALRYRTLSEDLEGNFVLAAAQRSGADYLVTTDRVLLAKATVAALAPQDMLKVLESGL